MQLLELVRYAHFGGGKESFIPFSNYKMHSKGAEHVIRSVSIEGNIGAGKSTFLNLLGEVSRSGIVLIDEPLSDWRSPLFRDGTKSLFKLYCDNPKDLAFTFQVRAFTSRQESFNKAIAGLYVPSVLVSERSMLTDYLFAEVNRDIGNITEEQWHTYKGFFELVARKLVDTLDVIIYLDVSAEVCHKRLLQRGRPEEATIPLDYLLSLQAKHEEMLTAFKGIVIRVPWSDSPGR